MTQISSYFATVGVEIDKRSFAEVDRYFSRLEQKLQQLGKTSNAFAINLKFNIDTARARLTIQRDLNMISRGLSLRLNTFSINNRALRNLLNQSMSNRAGNARIRLNAALSSSSLTNMRAQVQAALNNLVISPQINPRINPRGVNPAGGANPQGTRGSGGSGSWDMGRLLRFGLPLAGLYSAGRGFMSVAEATQLQATRDVASRGLFQNATMPDGSTRNVYDNSEKWFRGYTNRVGLDRNALTPSYQGFMAASMPTLGYEKSQKVFEAFSSFGTVRGATGDSMKRALVAVQQMAAKGQVMAEELNQQLGDAQGFGESKILFAQAWQMMKNKTANPLDPRLLKGSKSTSELTAAMKKSQVKPEDLLPIVSDLMLAKARPAIQAASQTGTANQNRFSNARTEFFENFAKGGGDAAMSNVWKALADLTGVAAKNAEMLGANFRVATAYVRLAAAYVTEFIDYISGTAEKDNIFKSIFTPEMEAQIKRIGDNLEKALSPLNHLDLTASTGQVQTLIKSILTLIEVATNASLVMSGMMTMDATKIRVGLAGLAGSVAGGMDSATGNAARAFIAPSVPSNMPEAATAGTAAGAGVGAMMSRTSNNNVTINNAVTITDKSQLTGAIDSLNQSALNASSSQFYSNMDKAAFPNSGQ